MMTIKKLNKVKFTNAAGTVAKIVTGYAFYEEGKGYVAYSHMRDRYGILTPYTPCGGKLALQSILNAGGFTSMVGMEYVNP